jgi:CRP-like cAMP-binding protein
MSADRPTIDVPPQVLDYLRGQHALTLATASPTGLPHAATMVYVTDGAAIYFSTRPGTMTARHIDQNPIVSFTIDEYADDWSQTQGIQGRGECRVLLAPEEIQRVVALFRQEFPFLANSRTTNLSFFRIMPTEVHFIDNQNRGGDQVGQTLGMEWRRSLVYSVFHDLPQQEVDTIAAQLDTVRVEAGEVIVRQGAPADKFFIIVEGEVEVVREDRNKRRSVATLRSGQFFGEIAIMREMPRTATVRALTPTTLLTMGRESFRGLIAQSLSTAHDFDRIVQHRLADLLVDRAQ